MQRSKCAAKKSQVASIDSRPSEIAIAKWLAAWVCRFNCSMQQNDQLNPQSKQTLLLETRQQKKWCEKLTMNVHEIETKRLRLRQWQDSDYPIFARMNADAETMRFFPATLSVEQSNAMAQYCRDLIEQQGWGVWAVEEKATATFIGFTGLHRPTDELPFSPCIEVAWRLVKTAWGNGFATEGADAALSFAFAQLAVPEIVSFTTLDNAPSERVMQRLGMRRDAQTFEHPSLPSGHPLREHVLYRAYPGTRTLALI